MDKMRELLQADYDNIQPLSRGGMGVLYSARKRSLDVDVVIKRVKSKHKKYVDQENEANILKNLKHQYLPRIYDVVSDKDGFVYTIMDLITGKDLRKYVKEYGAVSQKDAYKWACQLCEVVEYLHSQDPPIIHCDIKPANIMITDTGDICLIDFGTSLIYQGGALAVGVTPGFAAPEQYARPEQRRDHLENEWRRRNAEAGSPDARYAPIERMSFDTDSDRTETIADADGWNGGSVENSWNKRPAESDDFFSEKKPDDRGLFPDTEVMSEPVPYDNKETLGMFEGEGQSSIPNELRTDTSNRSAGSSKRSFTAAESSRAGDYGMISVRTDIYAIGASLYFAVTAKTPERALDPLTDISNYHPKISILFQNIIRRSMEKQQELRFSSAKEMLRALQDIDQLDARYKRCRRQRVAAVALCAAFFLSSAACTVYGVSTVHTERENTYIGLISQSEKYAEEGNIKEGNALLDEAIDMMPSRADAYISRAVQLYRIGQYEEALSVFDNAADSGTLSEDKMEESTLSNIRYIRANCLNGLDDYEEARKLYESALEYPQADSACYRGLALTQARLGDLDGARQTLDALRAAGGADVDDDVVSAEISAASGNIDEAIRLYRQATGKTDDWEVLRHCYVAAAKLYGKSGNDADEIALLEEASSRLDDSSAVQVREMLAETYMRAAEQGGGFARDYRQKAKELFTQMIENGYGTVVTSLNLASVEEKLGNYAGAEKELLALLDEYPYDYRVDMRLAFLYADWQSAKSQQSRDYHNAQHYYKTAKEKYQQALANGKEDSNMAILENLIRQIKAAGWL